MNKNFIAVTSVILLSTCSLQRSYADSDAVKAVCKAPLAAASMAAGTVVGTPIAIVRKTGTQYVDCVKEFKNDSNTYKFWGAFTSILVAPTSGIIKGTIYGPKNAIKHSVESPFSKDAFSLGNLEDAPAGAAPSNLKPNDKPELQPWGTH